MLRAALAALAPVSAGLGSTALDVAEELLRKGAVNRPLFGACLVAAAPHESGSATSMWNRACARLPELGPGLIRTGLELGVSLPVWDEIGPETGQPFAMRLVRAALGDGRSAAALPSLAARVPEAARTELVKELIPSLPAAWKPQASAAQALWSLARQERHTGRWLCFADLAARGGEAEPASVAVERAREYTGASAETWTLVALWLARHGRGDGLPVGGDWGHMSGVFRLDTLRKILAVPSVRVELQMGAELVTARHGGLVAALRALPTSAKTLASVNLLPWMLRARIGEDDAHAAANYAKVQLACTKTDTMRGPLACLMAVSGAHEDARDVADDLLRSKSLSARTWSALVRVRADQAWEASLPLWDLTASASRT